jgi:hypothetical protein
VHPLGFPGNESAKLGLPPSRILIFRTRVMKWPKPLLDARQQCGAWQTACSTRRMRIAMSTQVTDFEEELEVFRTEEEAAQQYFFAYLSVKSLAASDGDVLANMNNTPLFGARPTTRWCSPPDRIPRPALGGRCSAFPRQQGAVGDRHRRHPCPVEAVAQTYICYCDAHLLDLKAGLCSCPITGESISMRYALMVPLARMQAIKS